MSTQLAMQKRREVPSIADQVAARLRRQILNGELPAGSRLPPERELAPQLGTNRNTLREAVRQLEAEGLVMARRGGGTDVLDYRTSAGIDLLPHFLREVRDPGRLAECIVDALAIRRTAISLVVRQAAGALDDAGRAAVQAAMEGLRRTVFAQGDVIGADLAFVGALVHATRSLVIRWLMNTVLEIMGSLVRDPGLWIVEDDYLENMQAVCDAVCARDAERAAAAMIAHYEATDAALLQRLGHRGGNR